MVGYFVSLKGKIMIFISIVAILEGSGQETQALQWHIGVASVLLKNAAQFLDMHCCVQSMNPATMATKFTEVCKVSDANPQTLLAVERVGQPIKYDGSRTTVSQMSINLLLYFVSMPGNVHSNDVANNANSQNA